MINFNSNSGFTLLEIVVATSIISVIALMVAMFGIDIFDFGIFLSDNITSQQEIQLTLKNMVSEIRAMSQSVNGAYPIELAAENNLIFYSDIDSDGNAERVRYFIEDGILKKGVMKPSGNPLSYSLADEDISDQVHDIYGPAGNIFSYYDTSYAGDESQLAFPVSIPAVRMIGIHITSDPNPLDISSRIDFMYYVKMRNIQ